MDLLLDTANLEEIKEAYEIFNIKGVTTNPTIVAKCIPAGTDPYASLKIIWEFVSSKGGEFHVQVVSTEKDAIIAEAHRLSEIFDKNVHVKIPVTREGLKAIAVLSREGYKITATAIYSYAQAIYAHYQGATDLALYCNRMENIGVDYRDTVIEIKETAADARILGASFKTFAQVKDAILAGADAVTVQPSQLLSQLDQIQVLTAVEKFTADWNNSFSEA